MSDLSAAPRTLRVAAVQLRAARGAVADNLAHAEPFLAEAAARGARLAVLPELYATGYDGTRAIWRHAEAPDGRIARWAAQTAARLGLHLGCGFVERDGDDCYNAFVWASPEGNTLGVARKGNAEAYVFRRGHGVHVTSSEVGLLGTGICADNQRTEFLDEMARARVDLVVMPHAAPMFAAPSKFVDAAEVAAQRARMTSLPVVYAKALGVPVIFANQVGDFGRVAGIFGAMMRPMDFRLLGLSRLVDADGRVVAELGGDEGVAVADVTLDPARKRYTRPPEHDGTVFPVPAYVRRVVLPVDVALARVSYALRRDERRRCFSAGAATA